MVKKLHLSLPETNPRFCVDFSVVFKPVLSLDNCLERLNSNYY